MENKLVLTKELVFSVFEKVAKNNSKIELCVEDFILIENPYICLKCENVNEYKVRLGSASIDFTKEEFDIIYSKLLPIKTKQDEEASIKHTNSRITDLINYVNE